MASFLQNLPAPKKSSMELGTPTPDPSSAGGDGGSSSQNLVLSRRLVPTYPHRATAMPRFVPRDPQDYQDGGAYPEIHVLQYPREMGRKGGNTKAGGGGGALTKVVAKSVAESGEVDYTALVKQGENAGRIVHASYEDLVEKGRGGIEDAQAFDFPSEKNIAETVDKTKAALNKIISGAVAASLPNHISNSADTKTLEKAEYIRYTPANTNASHASGASQRIIKMFQAPVDPMEPPKFQQKKAPPAPPSPPAPVLHSPSRKATAEELEQWKIPPCVSNWKNARGYTVSLDKRLAADGRGLQDHRINDKFASLAESLYVAERTAREEVEKRAQIQRHISLKEKDKKEQELRELAARARAERAGIRGTEPQEEEEKNNDNDHIKNKALQAAARPVRPSGSGAEMEMAEREVRRNYSPRARHSRDISPNSSDSSSSLHPETRNRNEDRDRDRSPVYSRRSDDSRSDSSTIPKENRTRTRTQTRDNHKDSDDDSQAKHRDQIRSERRKEREREMRLRERQEERGGVVKKSKLSRDRDRDISERIALGQKTGTAVQAGAEVAYDQRLFNQGTSGLNSGHGAEDGYSLYDKPLFAAGAAASSGFLYKPKTLQEGQDEQNTSRFKADKGFGKDGAAGSTAASRSGARDRPVEFERDFETSIRGDGKAMAKPAVTQEEDPFGLDQFLTQAKKGRNDRLEVLEKGRKTMMSGGGSSGAALREEEQLNRGRRKRDRIDFQSGKG